MNILVTGAEGQLAKQFQETLKIFGHTITVLDKENLDISDPDAVTETVSKNAPDVVINCAAYNYVDQAEKDFDTASKVNALGVKNLASACNKNNALMVHFGSDYIFDGAKGDFYTEEDKPNPINKYGESKLLGEKFLQEETDNFILFRVSWVFGKGKNNFLYKLSEWADKNRILKIVCDQISVPTYTEDIVSITTFAIKKGLRGIYHLTNSGYASRYEVARYFLEKMGMDRLVLPVTSDYFPSSAKRPYFSSMSNQKISKKMNVNIPDWRIGIDRYIRLVFGKEEN
jgi:dTDP-4-dehydrorhamnose reductase